MERHVPKLWFTAFTAFYEENVANLPLPMDVKKLKTLQLQGLTR